MKGFNAEVYYKGVVFHVQTQDLGPREPVIQSLVYKAGRMIHSRRTSYASSLGQPDLAEKVQALLREQHNALLQAIRTGKFEHFLTPEEKEGSSGGA